MDDTTARFKNLIYYANLIATLALAVGGFYLNSQRIQMQAEQDYIKQQQEAILQRSTLEHMFTDTVLEYSEKFNMEKKAREDIMIELLDILTQADTSGYKTESEEDKKDRMIRKLLLPFRFALLTGNSEVLAHITTDDMIEEWVKFAAQSNSKDVKYTAIEALCYLTRHSTADKKKENISYLIEKVLLISDNLNDDRIRGKASEVILEFSAEIEPIDLEVPKLKQVLAQAYDNLKAAKIRSTADQTMPIPAMGSDTQVAFKNEVSPETEQKTQQAIVALEPIASAQIKLVEDKPVTVADDKKTEIDDLIKSLVSSDVEIRRKARKDLASLGSLAVQPLLESLQDTNLADEYRIRLGVAYVLYKMKQPVVIDSCKGDACKNLVALIGDKQSDVRKYSSEFIMKLYDKDSVNLVWYELNQILETERENQDKLYNAVVITGTWMRILPGDFDELKPKIRDRLVSLKNELDQKEWAHTIRLINEMTAAGQA